MIHFLQGHPTASYKGTNLLLIADFNISIYCKTRLTVLVFEQEHGVSFGLLKLKTKLLEDRLTRSLSDISLASVYSLSKTLTWPR